MKDQLKQAGEVVGQEIPLPASVDPSYPEATAEQHFSISYSLQIGGGSPALVLKTPIISAQGKRESLEARGLRETARTKSSLPGKTY